ncbi:hypothetical protein UMM65_17240 [Aureibaculum sp. 2210JD6-5]|uniref:hypothetical protein n=1 Tax=Aureibaculum sp. 2210JD6-5 TaxID=3103957 RepID=UPI002AACA5B6|nr:hypothetical protein [Aureibaculum sp. 2210JD6-5]MDY7396993.1 hypothetical protein [Aureibaculum sp. 2210JD6-5]
MNNKLVSQKRTLFGTNHNIEINGTEYDLKYTIKDAWKRLTGKSVIQINSEGALISEHSIKNRAFLTTQFIIGFILMYCSYLILMMIIESAKNGFVHYAH